MMCLPPHYSPHAYAHGAEQLVYRNIGLAIAKQLLGPTTLSADTAILQTSHIGGVTPWHPRLEGLIQPEFYLKNRSRFGFALF